MINFKYPWKAHIVDQPGPLQVIVSNNCSASIALMEFDDVDIMMVFLMRFSQSELIFEQHSYLRELLEEGSQVKWQFIEANDKINRHSTAIVLFKQGYSTHEITQLTGITGDRIHQYKSRLKKKKEATT